MNCKTTVEMLSAYLDRELASQERDAVRQHLAQCDRCRVEERDLRSLKGLLLGVRAPEPAADFEHRLMSRLHHEATWSLPRRPALPRLRPLAVAPWGGLAAAAVLAGIVVSHPSEPRGIQAPSDRAHPTQTVATVVDSSVYEQHSEAYWQAGDYPASPLMPTSYGP